MDNAKALIQSRTVWANLIGFIALVLAGTGVPGLEAEPLTDAVMQVIAGASFIASTFFRVIATSRIGT
jgi:uncharacterized membrane protein (DUF441 family)